MMRKVLNFVKGKKDDKKDVSLSLNTANISVEITDPTGVTTPSDDYDFIGTTQHCSDYEVDLTGKDKSISKLHKASWVGNLEKAKTHLKKIDPNLVDASNRTPLHLAAAQGHTDVVWLLLSHKARMDIYDSGGKTSFMKAVEGGYKELVTNMLDKGAELNSTDSEGNTALHIATKLGYYDIATVLLKKGANFESTNKKGESPLHIATTAEHMDLVELLLRYGAGVNVSDNDSRTPLMLAARCGNAQLAVLFLEYGAKRDLVDNSSFTAQDYAFNKGYADLAALLVTAAPDKQEPETEAEAEAEVEAEVGAETSNSPMLLGKQHSVSSGSLVPANGSQQDVSDQVDDGDSWNDSQASEPKIKVTSSKLKKFLRPSSDDEIGEESVKEEKNAHDSPQSCVIPPPLKPPRSWDLIQAGMIDDNTGSEVKRCSLTALGTLRSRRESFNDSNKSDVDSPITNRSLKEAIDLRDPEKAEITIQKPTEVNESTAALEIAVVKKDKSDPSAAESDWDSDESLPMDKSAVGGSPGKPSPMQSQCVSVDVHHVPSEDDDLPAPPSPSELLAPEDTGLLQVASPSAPGSGALSPEPVSEKRARMLLMQNQQSVELTLTDDRTEDKSDHSEGSPTALPRDIDAEEIGQKLPSIVGTLGREGTMLGYEEMWESNAAFVPTSPLSPNQDSALTKSHSLPRIDEKKESDGEQSPSTQIIIDLNLSTVTEIPDSREVIHSPVELAIASIPPPKTEACDRERKEVEDLSEKSEETKTPGTKRHVRNKSIFVVPPQSVPKQSEDVQMLQQSCLSQTLNAMQDHCIRKQLECYDEAIRDLALATPSKEGMSLSQGITSVQKDVLDLNQVHDGMKNPPPEKKMPDLLSNASFASLVTSNSFPKNAAGSDSSLHSYNSNDDEDEEGEGYYDEEEKENKEGKSSAQSGVNKPNRKKRKILFAMQKFEPTVPQNASTMNIDLNSSESDEEPAYWGAAGMSKISRQSTVIKRGDISDEVHIPEPASLLSPGSISLSDNVQHLGRLSSGTSNEDVTAPMEDIVGASVIGTDFNKGGEGAQIVIGDSDSGGSQQDGTPTRSYSTSHDSLLKHHLQAVTEERGRLAETTMELGERTEQLLYELADAREAARAKDEVISLLQIQLQRLEESHSRGLEEVQTHRFHLDSRDQELRHLEEVCRKAEEEKIHLKEIIRLKDKEISSLAKTKTSKEEETRLHLMAREHEKDATISELKIHLKYVEQERDKLQACLRSLEQQQIALQARTDALLEEKARFTAQSVLDLHTAQEDASKWRSLYESSLLKIEAMDSTQVKVLLDSQSCEGEAVQAYRDEICNAIERLEKDKEADRKIWQAKIKEEVGHAIQLLKSEYEKVEETLRKHNKTLEEMVEKLQSNIDISTKRQESLESQLSVAQEELKLKRKEASESQKLQLELSDMKHQALTYSHKLKFLSAELEAKNITLGNLQAGMEVLQKENKEMTVLLSEVRQQQEARFASEWSKLSETVKETCQTDSVLQETKSALDILRVENANLKAIVDELKNKKQLDACEESVNVVKLLEENNQLKQNVMQLSQQLEQLKKEQQTKIDELSGERDKVSKLSSELNDAKKRIVSKATSQHENVLLHEKEDLEKQIAELKTQLLKRDISPGRTSLSNASAMTDQVRWNQSGLMGVVQRQKEEIENLKAECAKLRNLEKVESCHSGRGVDRKKIASDFPKLSPNSLQATKKLIAENCSDSGVLTTKEAVERQNQLSYICEKCGVGLSPKRRTTGKENIETQAIEDCESLAHSSKCSSPRHTWNQQVGSNMEQELQAQAERCLKHQQVIAGLKSELTSLRGSSGDQSVQLKKQNLELQQKLKEEAGLRCSLEMQMNKMKYDMQEKGQLEREFEKLKGRLDKDFVSRRELDNLKMRACFDTENTLHSELSTRLAQMNKLLLQQAHDRSTGQVKENAEAHIRKEYEETRQYLISELAKVQISLQAKEDEEKELKLKCEKLSRECDKKNEQRRKKLLEKSNNLLGQSTLRDKDVACSDYKSPALQRIEMDLPSTAKVSPKVLAVPLDVENQYSQLLRKEVKRNVEKYKTSGPISDLSAVNNPEDQMEYLKKKYCLP